MPTGSRHIRPVPSRSEPPASRDTGGLRGCREALYTLSGYRNRYSRRLVVGSTPIEGKDSMNGFDMTRRHAGGLR